MPRKKKEEVLDVGSTVIEPSAGQESRPSDNQTIDMVGGNVSTEDAEVVSESKIPALVEPAKMDLLTIGTDYAVKAYAGFADAVAKVEEKFGNVEFDASTDEGHAFAKLACKTAAAVRIAAEKQKKLYGKGFFDVHKAFNEQEKAVKEPMSVIEDRAKAAIDAEEARQARLVEERRQKEAARIDAHRKVVNAMLDMPRRALNKDSATITTLLRELGDLSKRDFEELTEEAGEAYKSSADAMTEALDAARAAEAAKKKADDDAAELAELRKQKAELEAKNQKLQEAAEPEVAIVPPPAEEKRATGRSGGFAPPPPKAAPVATTSSSGIPDWYWTVLKAAMDALKVDNLTAIRELENMDLDALYERLTSTKV